MAAEAIDGDFVPIALASKFDNITIKRYAIGGGHSMEWVNIGMLRRGMDNTISGRPCADGIQTIHCLLALIAFTGTDYSRGIPTVGPKKLWGMLNNILPYLAECMMEGRLDPEKTEFLFGAIYGCAYKTHTCGLRDFRSVMGALAASKLSARTKQYLPSLERVRCTVRNANFILDYWLGHSPKSMDPNYGFREVDGVVVWADEA